jgi:protein gp37
MAETSHIEWTDATWNPITGCTMVSAGCTNCYAMTLAAGRLRHHSSRAGLTRGTGGRAVWTGEVRLNEQWLDQPLRWRRPRMIFVCAHGDLFHESVPDGWIDRVFAVMALAPHHTFQVLTKRPERARAYLADDATLGRFIRTISKIADDMGMQITTRHANDGLPGMSLANVWLGTSVEDQATADSRIPHLLATPAAVRFVSAEPLLGPVVLPGSFLGLVDHGRFGDGRLDWLIVGGESGAGARPMHPDWARSLRDQCSTAGVAFFMKQMAKKAPIPTDLFVREMPGARP